MDVKFLLENIDRYLTHYEREHGIKIRKTDRMAFGDIIILKNYKSDGDIGFVILFRGSIRKDTWLSWYPSENQMFILKRIVPDIIRTVEYHNKQNRRERNINEQKMS